MQKNNISWINHFIELIVVFIGITLAFMLNNWRENNRAAEMEDQYINSFYQEVTTSGIKLDSLTRKNELKCERLAVAIKMIQNVNFPNDSAIVVIADMAKIALFIPKTNTYESIRNSGNFNIIKSYSMSSKIIEYYESFTSKNLIENYYRTYIDDYFIPYFFENVDLIQARIINKNILNDFRFNNLVIGYYQLLVQVVEKYEHIQKLNIDLKQTLETEYGDRLN